jgi:putative resolvase
VNLTGWARAQGIHVQTLVSPQTAAGAARKTEGAGLYARVSSHDQKPGVNGQVARLSGREAGAGLPVVRVEAEVGSRMNGSRAKVRKLLADLVVTVVVVKHRDRFGRVNTELVGAALSAHDRRLVVLDGSEVTGDMMEVLTSFWARLYGRRAARNRALKALDCAQHDIGPKAAKLRACGGAV